MYITNDRFTAGTLLMATYGHEVTSEDDFITKIAVDAAALFIEGGTPGATIVDFLPFCEQPDSCQILMLNCFLPFSAIPPSVVPRCWLSPNGGRVVAHIDADG